MITTTGPLVRDPATAAGIPLARTVAAARQA